MAKILFVISIIFNIVLAITVFFRSALNEIFKQWWLEKRQAKKEHKQHLIDLRSNLLRLSRLSSTILIFQAMANAKTDPRIKKQMFDNSKPTLAQWAEINNTIEESTVHYPKDIQQLYAKYRHEMGKATEEVFLKSVYGQQSLIKFTDEVMGALSELIQKVDYYLEN